MLRIILIVTVFILCALASETEDCPCQNGGSCLALNRTSQFCECTNSFLGKQCQTSGREIDSQKQIVTIGSDYSYYYSSLNASTTYLVQIYFCPIEFQPNSRFKLYFEFENKDNSLEENEPKEDSIYFMAISHQCLLYRAVITIPYLKDNGLPPKLVVRLKHMQPISQQINKDDSAKAKVLSQQEPSQKKADSKFAILIYNTPIMQFESLSIGEYLFIFMFSALSLTILAVIVFRRALRRSPNRHQFEAARPTNTISHFDTMMPAVFQDHPPSGSQVDIAEEEECMICLLGVHGTEVRRTPCRHVFHKECIDEWGIKSLTCPFCRASLRDQGSLNNDRVVNV